MATYTVTTGRKTFKDATGADTYNISGDATRVTIAGKLVSGDIINIEGLASEYTVRASGRTVTLSNGVQTVVFQLSNVNGSASVRFMDGDLTASFNGKNAFLGTQKLGKKAVEVNDSAMGTTDSSGAFTGGTTAPTGSTFTLTAGIDSGTAFTGGSNNDTFNADETATSGRLLGGLDVIDGGAGNDTLNVAYSVNTNAFTFGGADIKNVETINVATNGDLTGLDISAIAGLTKFVAKAADTDATTLTAANTTDVALTLSTTANSTVAGGKEVSVTKGATAAGTLGISGKALTNVTVKGGAGAVTINNQENTTAATANKGTTMTSVTLDGVDANTGIGGEGLQSVTIKGATTAARTVTITNAKVDHALTVNVDGTGYQSDGTTEAQTVVVDSAAKTITVNATGSKSSLSLTGSTSATTVNVTGSADLKLNPLASATAVDGSAATGKLTLGSLNAATVSVKTGAGNDSFTLNATAKATVDSGAGNDTVTLGAILAAGSTVNLGAGDDVLLGSALPATSATATSVIDAGAGTDSLAAALVNAGNASLFKNFERLSISTATTLDASLISGIGGLTVDAVTNGSNISGLTTSQALANNFVGNNSASTTTLAFSGVSGTSDSYSVTFAGAAQTTVPTAANAQLGTIVAAGIENLNVVSGGGDNIWNSMTFGANTSARTVTITGSKNLDLAFAANFGEVSAANGTVGVSMIDGSAATGKLAINLANVVAATAGVAVKGGSADDTITARSTSEQTLTGGAGKDTFVIAAATGTSPLVTVTDLASGDKIDLAGTVTAGSLGDKVDVGAAVSLATALNIANGATAAGTAQLVWFQYGGNTYVYADLADGAGDIGTVDANDNIAKIAGLVNLKDSAYTAGAIITVA